MPRVKRKYKRAKKTPEAKSWDRMIKRYHFMKEVAKDIGNGIKNFGPTIAYVGTFGGAMFKGTMRFFGWDYPSIPGFGESKPSLVVEDATPTARRSAPNAADEGNIGLGRPDTIGHGASTEGETSEDQGDTVMLASAPVPHNDYLMAQTKAPEYVAETSSPTTFEFGLYYVNHGFWIICILFAVVYLVRHIKIKFVKEK